MTLCLEKARRAWVRLPRPLHGALLELRAEHPRPVVFGTSQFIQYETRLRDWNLADIKPGPFGINGEIVTGASLNRLGAAFAKHLPPLPHDRRSLPGLMPLADILADLPPSVLDWISGTPPIEKHAGGILFEALGVLLPTFRGDGYNPSRELMLALEELAFRRSGGTLRRDGPTAPLLSPALCDVLHRCLRPEGVPWKNDGFDGRLVRSIADKDGAGLITLRDGHWVVPHLMRPVAQALADGETDPFRLTILTPTTYREWVANGLPVAAVPEHPRLLNLIGVIRRKGKYDWRFEKDAGDIQSRVAAFLRASEFGDVVPDDVPYDGTGVDITLPDDDGPADVDWAALDMTPTMDLTLETEVDEFTMLAMRSADIVEAPVPSNAELAAMREARQERTLDHRDDYLDSVRPDDHTDDAFDIL